MPPIQCVSAHCCPRHSNCSTYMFHMLWSLLGSVSPASVRGKAGLFGVSHSQTTAECSNSVPSRTWTSTMFQVTSQASGCQTWCRPQPCFRRCIFLLPTKQLTGYRILACHKQHRGFLWLSDNNQLEIQDVLKAQTAASQQKGLC